MPTYVYRCPEHGLVEIGKTIHEAGRAEYCTACLVSARASVEMRRVYTPPVVQNLSATRDSLCSWGHDERMEKVRKDVWLAEEIWKRRELGPLED